MTLNLKIDLMTQPHVMSNLSVKCEYYLLQSYGLDTICTARDINHVIYIHHMTLTLAEY